MDRCCEQRLENGLTRKKDGGWFVEDDGEEQSMAIAATPGDGTSRRKRRCATTCNGVDAVPEELYIVN